MCSSGESHSVSQPACTPWYNMNHLDQFTLYRLVVFSSHSCAHRPVHVYFRRAHIYNIYKWNCRVKEVIYSTNSLLSTYCVQDTFRCLWRHGGLEIHIHSGGTSGEGGISIFILIDAATQVHTSISGIRRTNAFSRARGLCSKGLGHPGIAFS